MKRNTRLIAISIAVMMLLSIVPFSVSAKLSNMKVVCFGDSLTHYGDGWTAQKDEFQNAIANGKTYPDYLSEKIGTTVYNAGKGGDTTDMALRRLHPEVLAQNPDIVVICLGANDQAMNFVSNNNLTSLEAYRKNLEYYVETIKASGSDVVFLTPSPACHEAGCTEGSSYNCGQLVKYCNAMREVAIKYGISYVDANYDYSFLSNLSQYYIAGDGLHQSAKGREYFASLVANHLKALYENTNKATINIVCKDQNGKELKKYTLSGASGAKIILASPDLDGYTAVTDDIKTTLVNGATHTFTYKLDVAEIAQKSELAVGETNVDMADKMFDMYINGKVNANSSNPDFALLEEYAKQMQLISDSKTVGEFVLSLGASYTTTAPNYKLDGSDPYNTGNRVNPIYADDGKKLTDGYKSYPRGEDSRYSVWTSNADIIIDLGEAKLADVFRIYSAGDEWGVALQNNLAVSYKVNENDSWTDISATAVTKLIEADKSDNFWSRNTVTVTAAAPVNARYVKLSILKTGICIWIDEVEVALKNVASSDDSGIIHGINTKITGDDTRLFLGGYDFSNNNGNLKYAAYVIAKYNAAKGGFIVTEVGENNGTSKDFTLDTDSVLIASHNDGGTNWNSFRLVKNATVGQFIILKRIDTQNGVSIAPAFYVSDDASVGTNIVKNMSYVVSGSGGGYYNPNLDHPEWGVADYQANLTDGVASEIGSFDSAWFAFYWGADVTPNTDINTGIGTVTFDLKTKYDLTEFRVHCWNRNSASLKAPKKITVYVSDDGTKYTSVGNLSVDATDEKVYWAELESDTTGRYIKFEFALDSVFCFLNEIQVYGTVSQSEHIHQPEFDKWESDANNHWKECTCGEALEKSAHEEDDWKVVTPAQVGVEGLKELRCKVCGYLIDDEVITALEPEHVCAAETNKWYNDETGHWKVCSCGEFLNKSAHDGQWKTVKEAKVGVPGEKQKICKVCDYVIDTQIIPALDDSDKPNAYEKLRGDVNNSGAIDMMDYVLLKRAYFGTFDFDEEQKVVADVNNSGAIDMMDYVLLKRVYFGTFSIAENLKIIKFTK